MFINVSNQIRFENHCSRYTLYTFIPMYMRVSMYKCVSLYFLIKSLKWRVCDRTVLYTHRYFAYNKIIILVNNKMNVLQNNNEDNTAAMTLLNPYQHPHLHCRRLLGFIGARNAFIGIFLYTHMHTHTCEYFVSFNNLSQ